MPELAEAAGGQPLSCADHGRGRDPNPLTPVPIAYTSFYNGALMQEHGWVGKHVAVLTPDTNRDPCVMRRIVQVADQVYAWYVAATGREPVKDLQIDGRATIAAVAELPGAGFGRFGHTGIEVRRPYFETLYASVRNRNEFDHLIFYEMGRNFWFYGGKLDYHGPDSGQPYVPTVATGYAIFMRYMSIEATGVRQMPYDGHPFEKVYRPEADRLLDRYVADPKLDFDNTLRVQRAPASPVGMSWTDLSAAFLLRLRRVHGVEIIPALWRAVSRRPDARSTQDAIDNLVIAASEATRRDLSDLFVTRWRFPVSEAARRATGRFPAATLTDY